MTLPSEDARELVPTNIAIKLVEDYGWYEHNDGVERAVNSPATLQTKQNLHNHIAALQLRAESAEARWQQAQVEHERDRVESYRQYNTAKDALEDKLQSAEARVQELERKLQTAKIETCEAHGLRRNSLKLAKQYREERDAAEALVREVADWWNAYNSADAEHTVSACPSGLFGKCHRHAAALDAQTEVR